MPLLKTPEVTTASNPYRSAVVAVFVGTQATRPPHFRTLPVISVRTAMTAPTHSLSVRPEHLPVPPDWVLRLRVGSASTQQVASPRLTPGYRADRDLPGRGPCTPLEVRVSARDVDEAALVELAQSRGNADGQAQEASHIHGRAEQPVERLTARILEHEHGRTGVAHEVQRPHRPPPVQLILQFVFVDEAIEA